MELKSALRILYDLALENAIDDREDDPQLQDVKDDQQEAFNLVSDFFQLAFREPI